MTDIAAVPSRGGFDWLAITTFVLASLWLFGIGSLLALYFGRRSLRRTRASPELRGRSMTWAGLAVAVLGIALAVLWVGLAAIA